MNCMKREKLFIPVLGLLLLCGCLLPGCKIILTDDGEVGFKQSTSWSIYHTAKATKATATSETKPMSIEAWFANEKAGMTIVETTTESQPNN